MSAPFSKEAILAQLRSRAILMEIGGAAIAIIKERTLRGEFLEGSSPGASRYSTTPLPLPMGKLRQGAQNRIWARLSKGKEEIRVFTNRRSGNLWVILTGGYKRFRELAGKEVDRVTLKWSGAMIKALAISSVDEKNGLVKISFTNYEAAQLAGYHYTGVGKSRKKRIFLGLSPQEQKLIADQVMAKVKLQF